MMMSMDVKLAAPSIPYLDKDNIEKYANLKFYSYNYELVTMNPIMLAALRSPVVLAMSGDYEDCSVMTEFTKQALEAVNAFIWTGQCDINLAGEVFRSLGIDLVAFSDPLKLTNGSSAFMDVKIKMEDESAFAVANDFIDSHFDDAFDDFLHDPEPEPTKPKRKSKKNLFEEEEDIWGPTVKSRKVKTKKSTFNDENSEHMVNDFELPRPLDDYKVHPAEAHIKKREPVVDFDKDFSCDKCGGRFVSKGNLSDHIIRIHEEHLKCPYCYKIFRLDEEDKFKLHYFHHDQNQITSRACIQCGKIFRQITRYKDHQKMKGPYHDDQCAQCPKTFLSHEEYQAHVLTDHFGQWMFKCGHCKAVFEDEKEMKSHVSFIHKGRAIKKKEPKPKAPLPPADKVCEECGKHVRNLSGHMMLVHQNLEMPCPHCHLRFKNKYSVQSHIQTMHEKAPCSQCGEMVGLTKMKRHIAMKHTSIYDRKFKCDVCGKSFHESSRLKDHKNIHTGEKPYKCKFCSACFASKGTHAMHQRSHLGHRRSK